MRVHACVCTQTHTLYLLHFPCTVSPLDCAPEKGHIGGGALWGECLEVVGPNYVG